MPEKKDKKKEVKSTREMRFESKKQALEQKEEGVRPDRRSR